MKPCIICPDIDSIELDTGNDTIQTVWPDSACDVIHAYECGPSTCVDGCDGRNHCREVRRCPCPTCERMREKVADAHEAAEELRETTCAICYSPRCYCDEAYERWRDQQLEADR